MWKIEMTLLLRMVFSSAELLFGKEVHMYGARVSFPGPERLPPTRWWCLIVGGMARCGRDSLWVFGVLRRDWTRGMCEMMVSRSVVSFRDGADDLGGCDWELERKDGDSPWRGLCGSACSWTTAEREGPCWCRRAIGAIWGKIRPEIEIFDGRERRIVLFERPDMLSRADSKRQIYIDFIEGCQNLNTTLINNAPSTSKCRS